MAPKLKIGLYHQKDGLASTQTEAPFAFSNGDSGNVNLAENAGESSNRPRGPETSADVHIRQELSFITADILPAAPTNMEKKGERKSTIPSTTKGVDVSEPEKLTTNIKATSMIAKQGPNGAKRKSDLGGNEGPPTKKKHRACRRPRKHALEAAKYVSYANSLVLRGKNATLHQDIDLDLPTIDHAPTDVREHLKALEKAGLKSVSVDPETIKTHVKVLGGLCHAFRHIRPWLVERDGDPSVDDFKWKIQGLIHPLHSHQMLGSAIMIVIEMDENQGSGLLLNFMGPEKTIQTLACVVSNRACSSMKRKRVADGSATTLLVVPKSAVTQWLEEVRRHTQPKMSVVLWSKEVEIIRDGALTADILVVTYDQVRLMRKACKTRKAASLLFDVCYQRIVLDEAHKIKNRNSETFESCINLKGKHKWALTGTPITNGVHELWPLLRFIQHPSVKDFADFKQNYLTKKRGMNSKGGAEYEDLSKILLPISIMRTPGHQFCGVPLVTRPQHHAIKDVVPLGAEERVIQAYLEHYITGYIQTNCVGKSNYFCLIERLLGYRKFSASPLLLEGPVKQGLWTIDQVRLMKKMAQITGAEQTPMMDLFERWISEPNRDHLTPTNNRRMDSILAWVDHIICPYCSKRQNDPVLADCGHIWCAECVAERQVLCMVMQKEVLCPRCERVIGEVRPYHPGEARDDDKDAMRRRQGVDHNGFQPADDEGSSLFEFLDEHPEAPIPLSAKMERMLDLILKWQTEAPEDKIIIFSRFIGISRILGRLLQDRGIGYLYFLGQMNNDQYQNASVALEEDPAIKVLMVSSITVGEALSLTMANRCIVYDPWWHDKVEQRVLGLMNRVGQQKETHCVRLFAEGTIDDRMNDLQEKNREQKSAMAELESGKQLPAKTLRRILDGQTEREVDSDGSDADSGSEHSGQDGEDDYFEPELEDWNDEDKVS